MIKLREISDIKAGDLCGGVISIVIPVYGIGGQPCLSCIDNKSPDCIQSCERTAKYADECIGGWHRSAAVPIVLQLLKGLQEVSVGFRLVQVHVLEQFSAPCAHIASFQDGSKHTLF